MFQHLPLAYCDSSPPARGNPHPRPFQSLPVRFIPSCEGQTSLNLSRAADTSIHPLLRRANVLSRGILSNGFDSSPHTRGRRNLAGVQPVHAPIHPLIRRADHHLSPFFLVFLRFIPSYEGQTSNITMRFCNHSIHPFLRRANLHDCSIPEHTSDSSLPAKGRHSVFMRLLAALNTSLYNLHKCHSRFIHIFNIPKNPPHFHFF